MKSELFEVYKLKQYIFELLKTTKNEEYLQKLK